MKFLIGLVLLLGCSLAQATYIPNDCPLKVGDQCFTQVEKNRFYSGTLAAGGGVVLYSSNITAGRGTNLRLQDGTDFQVPAGTTLDCRAGKGMIGAGAGVNAYTTSMGYSDSAVPLDTASPGVNPVYFGGSSAFATFLVTNTISEASFSWQVPATKYPFFIGGGGGSSATFFCFIN